MNRISSLIILLIFCAKLSGQERSQKSKFSAGVLVSPGYKSPNEKLFSIAGRGYYGLNSHYSVGNEINYLRQITNYHSSVTLGEVLFLRISPFKKLKFYTELGLQYYKTLPNNSNNIDNSHNLEDPTFKSSAVYSPFICLGYNQKLMNRLSIDLQFRPLWFKGNETELTFKNNPLARFYIGANYHF